MPELTLSPAWASFSRAQGRSSGEAEAIVSRLEQAAGIDPAAPQPLAVAPEAAPNLRQALTELFRRYPGRLALGCALAGRDLRQSGSAAPGRPMSQHLHGPSRRGQAGNPDPGLGIPGRHDRRLGQVEFAGQVTNAGLTTGMRSHQRHQPHIDVYRSSVRGVSRHSRYMRQGGHHVPPRAARPQRQQPR